jgi:hypothetical protein
MGSVNIFQKNSPVWNFMKTLSAVLCLLHVGSGRTDIAKLIATFFATVHSERSLEQGNTFMLGAELEPGVPVF